MTEPLHPDRKAQPDAPVGFSEGVPKRGWTKKKWAYNIVGGLVLGIALNLFRPLEDRLPPASVLVPTYTLGLLASILAHEAGHLIAALAVRFEVVAFAVWPFKIHRTKQGWRLGFLELSGSGIGGSIAAYPVGTDDLVRRMLWIVVSGPAASWVLGIAATVVLLFPEAGSNVWVSTTLTALAFWSLLCGITSLLPNLGKYGVSDGARLRKLRGGGPRAEQFVSLLILVADAMRGRRPRDWDPDLIRRASDPMDDTLDSVSGQALRYNWLHDTRRLEEAGPLVEWIAARMPSKEARMVWRLEAAWFQARHRGDLIAARQWFDHLAKPGKAPNVRCAYFKAKAAIACAEEQWADAAAAAREVVKESNKLTVIGIAEAIRDEAEAVLRDITSACELKESQA